MFSIFFAKKNLTETFSGYNLPVPGFCCRILSKSWFETSGWNDVHNVGFESFKSENIPSLRLWPEKREWMKNKFSWNGKNYKAQFKNRIWPHSQLNKRFTNISWNSTVAKVRFSKKVTKNWKNLPVDLTLVAEKYTEFLFQFLWPSLKT